MSATVATETGVIPQSDQVESMIVTNSTVVLGGTKNGFHYPLADTMLQESTHVESMGAFYPLLEPVTVPVPSVTPINLVNTVYQHRLDITMDITGVINMPASGLINGHLLEVILAVEGNAASNANVIYVPSGSITGATVSQNLDALNDYFVFQWIAGHKPGWIIIESHPVLP